MRHLISEVEAHHDPSSRFRCSAFYRNLDVFPAEATFYHASDDVSSYIIAIATSESTYTNGTHVVVRKITKTRWQCHISVTNVGVLVLAQFLVGGMSDQCLHDHGTQIFTKVILCSQSVRPEEILALCTIPERALSSPGKKATVTLHDAEGLRTDAIVRLPCRSASPTSPPSLFFSLQRTSRIACLACINPSMYECESNARRCKETGGCVCFQTPVTEVCASIN